MAFDALVLPLRAVQAVFSIIVLGLSAYVISAFDTPLGSFSPDSVDFLLFCSIWTLLVVAYLVVAPLHFPALAHKFAILGVEVVTVIFWFSGWIAVAAFAGDWHFGKCDFSYCRSTIAADIFAVFIWFSFLATTAIAALHVRNTSHHDTSAPPQMQAAAV